MNAHDIMLMMTEAGSLAYERIIELMWKNGVRSLDVHKYVETGGVKSRPFFITDSEGNAIALSFTAIKMVNGYPHFFFSSQGRQEIYERTIRDITSEQEKASICIMIEEAFTLVDNKKAPLHLLNND